MSLGWLEESELIGFEGNRSYEDPELINKVKIAGLS